MTIDPGIFKAYDVRGTYPDQITDDIAYRLGRGVVAVLGADRVAVGRDMRLSSPALAKALLQGITDQGADAVDLGEVSSDELYFAVGKYGYPAGVMVTASHNPGKYNGIKVCRENAAPVSSTTGFEKIKEMVLSDEYPPATRKGQITQQEVLPGFVTHVLSFLKESQSGEASTLRPMTIVVDAGNGMAGKIVPAVFASLPIKVIPLYFELDGHFPNHPASPIEPENMVDLQKAVREHHADLGAAFDGDADRIFLTNEHGDLVDGSMVTAMVAKNILGKHPGSTILYNLICSRSVPEVIEKAGGTAVRTRVGHSFIKAQMRERNAIFGGEHSGHFYYRDNWFADSGIITLLLVLELLSEEGKSVSDVLKPLDARFRSGEINSHVADIPGKIEEIQRRYKDGKIDHLDGITIQYDSWWFNVRASNTEPLIRLNVEADTRDQMEQKRDELLALIRAPGA